MSSELEEARSLLIGQRIQRLLITPFREMDSGLGTMAPAFFFSVVMELHGGEKSELQSAWIGPWKGNETLAEVTDQFKNVNPSAFRGRKITDVCANRQQQWYVMLDNGFSIRVVSEWGDDLLVEIPEKK